MTTHLDLEMDPMPEPPSVALTPDRALGVVRPHGEIDLSTADALRPALERVLDCREVVIDLAQVSFMASVALDLFIQTRNRLGDRGQLRIVNIPRSARRVFEATGLVEYLNVEMP